MAQKYKLIYCAKIDDEKHQGMLKVGDTDFTPTKELDLYTPEDPQLVAEANARIRGWSGTASVGAELVYCEALIRYNALSKNNETYRDSEVHKVLQNSGFPKIEFDAVNDSGTEWFKVDLGTVKAAIKASKEHRDYLDTSKLPKQTIFDLRDEQERAVKSTISRFKSNDKMLWHAKMRFGKTITALNLVKRQGYKRVIIVTHRPVVEDSWGSDFYHVFGQKDKYVFLTKIADAEPILDDNQSDPTIDNANDERLERLYNEDANFVYFASIQDLRGSTCVKESLKKHNPTLWRKSDGTEDPELEPKTFNKNNIVFKIKWDLVIIDEAHEGTQTALGQEVLNMLLKYEDTNEERTKKLDLSGTAFNLFDEYPDEKGVFTWDYVMEQEAKETWQPTQSPNQKNPYADMPKMHIHTIDLAKAIKKGNVNVENNYFSFREFFRTWTGELNKDKNEKPDSASIGDFVHEDEVKQFLDMLVLNSSYTNFPYATEEKLQQNAHSLWMVPGVKEGAALSKMLREHKFFTERNFGIANVAGDGDQTDERGNRDALKLVRKTIASHPYTITISCGRLTTGVTVKEWSAVFMLSGSQMTDAKNYMQTIFRVQSAGKVNGVQKTDAYVYDFAPDRTLLVLASAIMGSRHSQRGGTNVTDVQNEEFGKFLKFCPVVAVDGAEFKPFGVQSLVSQINRVQIDRALRTGFMDDCIYDTSKFKKMTRDDIKKMNKIFKKVKETTKKKPLSTAGVTKHGVPDKNGDDTESTSIKSGRPSQSDEEKKQEKEIISRLRTISIRIPLLFFGGDFEIEEGRLSEIITGIDQTSWDVFMPEGLTKEDFKELVQYYNQVTVIGAGKIIRNKALAADKLSPTERLIAITNIFGHFHNPSKETVLTPWRVVNMHLASMMGGWCFYNESFEEDTDEYYKRLLEPRFVHRGRVTGDIFANPSAKILEINSKSGLYPLYATYNIYRSKLGFRKESDMLPEELTSIWDEAVKQVYVLCQSSMAASITRRTLVGHREVDTKIKYDEKLLTNLRSSIEKTVHKISKGSYWNEEVKEMKFDAIVGNPPYQAFLGGKSPLPIYHLFIDAAIRLNPSYVSMISPSRWFNTGSGLDDFRKERMDDKRMRVIHDFVNAQQCFSNVDIKGGINYFLWDKNYHGDVVFSTHEEGKPVKTVTRPLFVEGIDIFIRNEEMIAIYEKVKAKTAQSFADILSSQDPFGFDIRIEGSQKRAPHQYVTQKDEENNIEFYYNNWRKEGVGYVPRNRVKENEEWIDKYKILIPKAWGTGVPGKDKLNGFIVKPGSVCTETYIVVGPFDTEAEAKNALAYTKTTFFLAMVSIRKTTQNAAKGVYQYVPMQDFSKPWTDEELYAKYGLTEEEIAFIESMIRPMNVDNKTDEA